MKPSETSNQESSIDRPFVQIAEAEEGADLKDRIDFLFKVIGRFDFYINTTNVKGSLILAWNGVLIGSLFLKYDNLLALYPDQWRLKLIASAFLSLTGITALISSYIAFRVVFPFLQSSSRFVEPQSLAFFGSVAMMKSEDYSRKVLDSSKEKILDDLADQSVTLAKGLQDKMQKIRKSVRIIYWELSFLATLLALKLLTQFL